MARIIAKLDSKNDTEYDPYYNKLRGVVWDSLNGSPFEELHDVSSVPKFSYSNIFPYSEIVEEGEQKNWIFSSGHNGMVEEVYNYLNDIDSFEVGEMYFDVNDVLFVPNDVGSVGTSGKLETGTGIFIRVPEEKFDDYDINVDYNSDVISWEPSFSLGVFEDRFMDNLLWKFNSVNPDYVSERNEISEFNELFNNYSLITSYPTQVVVSEDNNYSHTFILSKWRMDYEVKSENHRCLLNTLLSFGGGWRNSLGFGFINNTVQNGKKL